MAVSMSSLRRIFAGLLVASLASANPRAHAAEPPTLRCPAPAAERDRTVTLPRAPEPATSAAADTPIEVISDGAVLGVRGDATLGGNVRIVQGERELSADDVRYDAERRSFKVRGDVRYRDPLVRARGALGTYDPASGSEFEGAEFELPEQPSRGAARKLELGLDGHLRLSQVWFSTCPAAEPAWRIRAQSLDLDTRARIGTGRDAAIEFMGVPILYLPYLSFPLGAQRMSGFLFPNLGHSTRGGVQIAAPYYFDLAPNYDLLLQPSMYGRRGLDLDAKFRYLTQYHTGSVQLAYLPADRLTRGDRNWLHVSHRSELPAGWRFDLDGQSVSDSAYFEDFSRDTQGSSTTFLRRVATLRYRDDAWLLRGEFEQFQTIDRSIAGDERPYASLPRLRANGRYRAGPDGRWQYDLDAELVNFDRDVGVRGWRADLAPRLALDYAQPGYYLRPEAGVRYTRYALRETASATDPVRTLPFASVDAGFLFENTNRASALRVTLEPRLLYLWTPYRDQNALPVFDTAIPDLDFVQLFRSNRYVGPDRVSDANQASIGFTSQVFARDSGRRLLSATLGQTVYFETPRVRLPDEPAARRTKSDLVAQLGVSAWADWNVDFGLQWNPQDRESERTHVRVRYRPDADRALNFAYRQQRGRLEQGELSGVWPLGARVNAFARVVYDLQEKNALDRYAGLEFKACCWRLRLVGRRNVSTRTGTRDTGIFLQLELNGLASVGSPADAFLEQAIRGYSRAGASR
jgi:LPS-assembly protein